MSFFQPVIDVLKVTATIVPLEIFVVFGSVLEEIIAPIPSPLVMTLAGSFAQVHKIGLGHLLILAVLGSAGKTLGSWVLYVCVDKMEDVFMKKFGKYIGVTHADIEHIGQSLNKGWKDNVFLLLARALPIIPSAPIAFVCGAIKLDLTTFITSTFLGTIIRNLLFLYIGYTGLSTYTRFTSGLEEVESIIQMLIGGGIAGLLVWAYYKRGARARHRHSSSQLGETASKE